MIKIFFALFVFVSTVFGQCGQACGLTDGGVCVSPLDGGWVNFRRCGNDPTVPPASYIATQNFDALSNYFRTVAKIDPGVLTNTSLDLQSWEVFAQESIGMNPGPNTSTITRYTTASGLDLYHYKRSPASPDSSNAGKPVLIYVHGGAFILWRAIHFDHWARKIVDRTGISVILVDYNITRFDPTTFTFTDAYPRASLQVREAIQYVYDHSATINVNRNKIFVGGDSAGGHLSVSGILRAFDNGTSVAGSILLSPFLDPYSLSETLLEKGFNSAFFISRSLTQQAWGAYKGFSGALQTDKYFNVFASEATGFVGVPRTIIFTGEYDPLRGEGKIWYQLLNAAGKRVAYTEYGRMPHDSWLYDRVYPDTTISTIDAIASFINRT